MIETLEITDLAKQLNQLAELNSSLSTRVVKLELENEQLRLALIRARHDQYGKKSEVRRGDNQPWLGEWQNNLGSPSGEADPTGEQKLTVIPEHTRKTPRKAKAEDEVSFDASLPRKEQIIEPENKMCSCCGEEMVQIGETRTEKLAVVPQQFFVEVTVRPTFACRKSSCQGEIKQAPVPVGGIKGSKFAVSFVVWVLVQKYLYHSPLYRIHQMLEASKVHISRGTLTNLAHSAGELLRAIAMAQWKSVLASEAIHVDETPQTVGVGNRKKDKKFKKGWLWPIVGDRNEVVFHFDLRRSCAVLEEVLKDYGGFINADGFGAYEKFCNLGNALLVSCWDHARREFVRAEREMPELAKFALGFIRKLYENEARIKELKLEGEAIVDYRQKHSKPVLEEFKSWIEAQIASTALLPKDRFRKACNYALRRWDTLTTYLLFSNLRISNIQAEQTIRPTVIGRKNWLFHGSEDGAEYSAILYGILLTCRLQEISAAEYLTDVFGKLLSGAELEYDELTPRRWKEARETTESPISIAA